MSEETKISDKVRAPTSTAPPDHLPNNAHQARTKDRNRILKIAVQISAIVALIFTGWQMWEANWQNRFENRLTLRQYLTPKISIGTQTTKIAAENEITVVTHLTNQSDEFIKVVPMLNGYIRNCDDTPFHYRNNQEVPENSQNSKARTVDPTKDFILIGPRQDFRYTSRTVSVFSQEWVGSDVRLAGETLIIDSGVVFFAEDAWVYADAARRLNAMSQPSTYSLLEPKPPFYTHLTIRAFVDFDENGVPSANDGTCEEIYARESSIR